MRRVAAACAIGVTAAMLAGCGGSSAPKAKPFTQAPVELAASLSTPETIGVLYSSQGQGSDWVRSAGGAAIAAYRLDLGGSKVTLEAQDDRGTAAGATAAVHKFVTDGVSGIVIASQGSHLDAAIAAASAANVPTILPYYAPASLPTGVWTLAPTTDQVGTGLQGILTHLNRRRPLVIEGNGAAAPGVSSSNVVTFTGNNQSVVSARLTSLMKSGSIDSVVITGDAELQAAAVKVVQGWSTAGKAKAQQFVYPVILTPNALSPVFAQDLVVDKGVLDGTFNTVGLDTGQVAALGQTEQGSQLAAFYSAVGMAASGSTVQALDGTPFGQNDEIAADTESHDAVVALVRAAQQAKSTHAGDVLKALGSLSLDASKGLAGPDLTFSTPTPLASDFVSLSSTPSGPNLLGLPATQDPAHNFVPLYWFSTASAVNVTN